MGCEQVHVAVTIVMGRDDRREGGVDDEREGEREGGREGGRREGGRREGGRREGGGREGGDKGEESGGVQNERNLPSSVVALHHNSGVSDVVVPLLNLQWTKQSVVLTLHTAHSHLHTYSTWGMLMNIHHPMYTLLYRAIIIYSVIQAGQLHKPYTSCST